MVALEASRLFRQLSPKELSALRLVAKEKTFGAGRQIFKEGDKGDGIYVVKDGLVEVSAMVGRTVRHVFARIGPGDVFGEMAVVDYKSRSATAVAATDTAVYFIPRDEILNLLERSPVLAMVLLREISDRLREFNHHYIQEALQAERLAILGRFARSIVHDLKNPLNNIGLSAEIAAMEGTSPQVRAQAVARIGKQVERISDMIGEILEFAQGEHSDFVLAPTNYGAFVLQLAEELRPEIALKAATLEVEGPLPQAELLLNPKRLRRVFYNLLHNATDAMGEGGRVKLRVRANEKEVVTEIEDSGPGVASEIAGQLFEAFATHGKAHGSGLGLSICKRIIEDHQGRISAHNGAEGGAIFSFALPLPKRNN